MSTRIKVIINASAGTDDDKKMHQRLAEIFEARGLDASISPAKGGEEIVDLARDAAGEDFQTIVAGGGDGTINAVASEIVGTDKVLGVLPLGTLNHFARDLHIPDDLEDAARTIAEGHITRVDVGEVNGRIFLNNSGLGLYPSIVHHREQQQEQLGRGKWHAFIWAALTVLGRYHFLSIRLNINGKELARRTPFVFIGNNEYDIEGFNIGGRTRLDAGQLSLYITHRTGRLGLLWFAVRAAFGHLREAKDFDALCTEEVWIETRHSPLRVATDGEVTRMDTPLHYRVRPGALRVIVPGSKEEARK